MLWSQSGFVSACAMRSRPGHLTCYLGSVCFVFAPSSPVSVSCSPPHPPEESPPPPPDGQGSAAAAVSLIDLEAEGSHDGEGWAAPAADEESGVLRGEFENLWPLQLVDLRDDEMVGTLFRLLRRLPQVPSYACHVFVLSRWLVFRQETLACMVLFSPIPFLR